MPDRYWSADSYARAAVSRFQKASDAGDVEAMRHVFFAGATLYTRTLDILARAVGDRRAELGRAAAGNLVLLHRALARMHAGAREIVPVPIAARDAQRERMIQDLIVSTLEAAGRSLRAAELEARVEERDLLGDVPVRRFQNALAALESQGILVREGERCRLTGAVLHPLNLDHEALSAMLPAEEYARLCGLDFAGVSEVAARPERFREIAAEALGWDEGLAADIARACAVINSYSADFPAGLTHSDLIHSDLPRPYQYEAFAVFRGMGYNRQVVEAPTGSGKTLIGMLCIQDWLAGLTEGERILVLVPTQSYQRQWVRELCYLDTGLQLSPEHVWAGSPAGLESHAGRHLGAAAVLVMTYAALADTAAQEDDPAGECPDLRAFFETLNIRHVVLDEVHKLVQDLKSPSALLARALSGWNREGKIRNLIGFSGTAEVYRDRLAAVGLEFAFRVPAVEIVAHGFIAPFGELAIPFAYSRLERQIQEALEAYKDALRGFFAAIGGETLRARWAALPADRRLAAAHALSPDASGEQAAKLTARVEAAGRGGAPVTLRDAWMVALLQALEGTGDDALAEQAADPAAARACLAACRNAAAGLPALIRLPSLSARLARLAPQEGERQGTLWVAEGGSSEPQHPTPNTQHLNTPTPNAQRPTPDIAALLDGGGTQAARRWAMRDALAVTVAGASLSFGEWSRQTGEGRVGAIRAALQAERRIRAFQGAIIFDAGRPIRWHHAVPAPGFAGVGGTFAELLRDPLPGVTPLAALSAEFYLPLDPPGLPESIAAFIRDRIMVDEIGEEVLEMAARGLGLHPDALARLDEAIRARLRDYAASLPSGRRARRGGAGAFRRAVLSPLRRSLKDLGLGRARGRVAERLGPRNRHLASLISAFYDHAAVAALFRAAQPREWVGTDGQRRACAVIVLPEGARRQLMYEMTSRILDAPELEINLILVSSWARTGWNVRRPNVLLDATATRDPTAWQQLRGRAMRALPGWSSTCARAAALLTGAKPHSPADRGPEGAALPSDVLDAWRSLQVSGEDAAHPGPEVVQLLLSVVDPSETELAAEVRSGDVESWTGGRRSELLIRLLRRYNKVTHLYELVKASGESQVIKVGGQWRRRPEIEAKHAREESVNPLDGTFAAGAGHAPLLYVSDPRSDLPEDLEAMLAAELEAADAKIILGWARAAELRKA